MKKKLGVYVDTQGVAVAEVEGNKLSASVFLSFPSLLEEKEESVELSSALKMEALLQKGLREVKTELKEVYVGFSEKEAIFRLLEFPPMSRKELNLALPLEIEKYIPFKLEEVAWDHKERKLFKERKIKVAFLGMKKDFLEEMKKIFSNVGAEIRYVGFSSLSLVGLFLSLNKIDKKKDKNFVFISFSEAEAGVSIFTENFPYFLRDIKIPFNSEGEPDFKKVGNELKITLEYYRREAGSRDLEKLFILGKKEVSSLYLEELKDLNIPLELLNLEEILADKKVATLQELKAYALALKDQQPSFLTFDILKKREEISVREEVPGEGGEIEPLAPVEVPWNFTPVIFLGVAGLIFLGAIIFIQAQRETAEMLKLKEIKKEAEDFPLKVESLSLDALKSKDKKLEGMLSEVKKNLDMPKSADKLLELIGENTTAGMWLREVRLRKEGVLSKRYTGVIQGYIYLENANREKESLTRYADTLRDSFFKEAGLEVRLRNVERQKLGDFEVTFFELEIR